MRLRAHLETPESNRRRLAVRRFPPYGTRAASPVSPRGRGTLDELGYHKPVIVLPRQGQQGYSVGEVRVKGAGAVRYGGLR